MRTAVALTLLAALALPARAHAAPTVSAELVKPSVRYGASHTVTGTLTDGQAPLAGQEVVLEGRRYPYGGSDRIIARATTDETGAFTFKVELDRNHRLHVTVPALRLTSALLSAYTLPAFELSFRALEPGVVRLYQRYTVPRSVKLTAPTYFYLGSRRATKASLRRTAKLKRTAPGRYTSQVDVTLPAGWKGAFRYASCFRPSPGIGMGDPASTCPKLRLAF